MDTVILPTSKMDSAKCQKPSQKGKGRDGIRTEHISLSSQRCSHVCTLYKWGNQPDKNLCKVTQRGIQTQPCQLQSLLLSTCKAIKVINVEGWWKVKKNKDGEDIMSGGRKKLIKTYLCNFDGKRGKTKSGL